MSQTGKVEGIRLVSATLKYPGLTNKLTESAYAICKAQIWFALLKESKRPTKWAKPTRNGTRIEVDFIHDVIGLEVATDELETYLREINARHELDLKIEGRGGGE